ncbi:MAG: hypothetical protein DRJ61_17685, partial [Acidobacteria bacterium]
GLLVSFRIAITPATAHPQDKIGRYRIAVSSGEWQGNKECYHTRTGLYMGINVFSLFAHVRI